MFDQVPIIMGGVENELACLMPQYINEDGWKLKKLADGFDQLGPEFLLGLAPEEVTNEDTATANIIRIEYMNEGILPFCIVILFILQMLLLLSKDILFLLTLSHVFYIQ